MDNICRFKGTTSTSKVIRQVPTDQEEEEREEREADMQDK